MASGPLSGFRVIDITMYVAGPLCTQILADLGAEVVKVERPPDGDVYRRQGPEFLEGESISFLALNKGKRSVVIDLKDPEGRDVMERLLQTADVFVHNLKPGAAERLGLGKRDVARIAPQVIWASLSGYGGIGPKGDLGGYDLIMQGESGLMEATGYPDLPPTKAGYAVVDINAGVLLALGIVGGVLERERTGVARPVETSLYETAIGMGTILAERYLGTGKIPARLGSASPLFSPYEAYRTADGYVTVEGTGPPGAFERFCDAIGAPELATQAEFRDNASRVLHQDALRREVEARTTQQPTEYWIERFGRATLPCGPILNIGQALESVQTEALGMVVQAAHPRLGTYRTVRFPLRFGASTPEVVIGAPLLGESTRELLRDLGYKDTQIDDWADRGVIGLSEGESR
jgi:crotonobetainyl-CoA:carnitine CoA-transferase CaiB-like acyl-CoA transferase